jgi:hypothetical protein
MKKILFMPLFIALLLTAVPAAHAFDYSQGFGIGFEMLSEVLLGIRVEKRINNLGIAGDFGYLPTETGGGVSMYRLSFRKYMDYIYLAGSVGQWSGASNGTFADVALGAEAHLGALSLGLEVGPMFPLTDFTGSENTVAFITSISLMLWF